MKTLAEIYPKGIHIDGPVKIKLKLFEGQLDQVGNGADVGTFDELIQQLVTTVAQTALVWPSDAIIDRTPSTLPGSYLTHRPQAVMDALNALGRFFDNVQAGNLIAKSIRQTEYEDVVLSAERYGWEIGMIAKRIDV